MSNPRYRFWLIAFALLPGLAHGAYAIGQESNDDPKVIYGADDRVDVYQETDPGQLARVRATCGLLRSSSLMDNGNGTYTINAGSYAVSRNLCPSEPYASQPTAMFCTGFMVGPRRITTAGHCLSADDIDGVAIVFGFEMLDTVTPVTTVNADQVYFPTTIISQANDGALDYCVVDVDRDITSPGASPLPLRTEGAVTLGQQVGVIGHPVGIPMKIAFGASTVVTVNDNPNIFEANLDTYGGNSGSPVFDQATGIVEGILVDGATDFTTTEENEEPCQVSSVLDDSAGTEGVTRSSVFAAFVSGTEGEKEGTVEGEGEGLVEGAGEGALEGESEGVVEGEGATDYAVCPDNSLQSQPPDRVSEFIEVLLSDANKDRIIYENFTDLTGPVSGMVWWGLGLDTNNSESECVRDPNTFRLSFYTDGGGAPLNLVDSIDVTPLGEPAFTIDGGPAVLRYEVSFDTPIPLTTGWVSIQGIDNPPCDWVWYPSLEGDGLAVQEIVGTSQTIIEFNPAICFTGDAPEGEGDGGGPPANDNCASATDLPQDGTILEGTTVNATNDSTSVCGADDNLDVWYTFTVEPFGEFSVYARSSDMLLTMSFSSACGTLEENCLDAVSTGDIVGGTLLYGGAEPLDLRVRIAGKGDAEGTFQISTVQPLPEGEGETPLESDLCELAAALPFNGVPVTGNTFTATQDGFSSCELGDDLDVWYTLTVPPNAQFELTAQADSPMGITLSLFNSCGVTPETCYSDALPGGTAGGVIVYEGDTETTFYVRVAGTDGASGEFTLTADLISAEGEGEGLDEGEGEGVKEGEGEGGADSIFEQLLEIFATAESSGNNTLTLAEIQSVSPGFTQQDLDDADYNGDDELSVGELLQFVGGGILISADTNGDFILQLTEVLRLIQLYNAGAYACAENAGATEDGFSLTAPPSEPNCVLHSIDRDGNKVVTLSELLRGIQLYNLGDYTWCPGTGSEDDFCG